MGGWRDTEGQTASERRKTRGEAERARLIETARHSPLSLVKGLLGFVFILLLVFVVIGWLH